MARTTVAQLEARVDELEAQLNALRAERDEHVDRLLDAKLDELRAKRKPRQAGLPGIEGSGTSGCIAFRKTVTNAYGSYYNIRLADGDASDADIAGELGVNVRRIDRHTDKAGRTWANVYPS